MQKRKPVLTINNNTHNYSKTYEQINTILINLLDTPIIKTVHIGSTSIDGALTSGVIDILVVVKSLHAMTTLDEKRLNLQHFYRLHHPYQKKCVYAQFNDLQSLTEVVRLHIVEEGSKKLNQYLEGQSLFKEHIHEFNHFKENLNHDISVKEYENNKSEWFRRKLSV